MKKVLELLLLGGCAALDWQAVKLFLEAGFLKESIGLHSAAAIATVGIVGIFLPRTSLGRVRWTIVALLFPVVFCIPVFGVVLAGAVAQSAGPGAEGNRYAERYKSLAELRENDPSGARYFGTNLSSLAEIMRTRDSTERRNATLALKNIHSVESLPILRRLSQDDDELVRLFALSERRGIVNEFEQWNRVLANKRKKGEASMGDLMRLAESYMEEVEIGLLSSERQREALLRRALDVLWEARRHPSPPPDIEFTILRCALLAYDTEVAERAFYRLERSAGSQKRLFIPRCEFYFQTGNWKELLKCLGKLPDSFRTSPAMARVLDLWGPVLSARKGGGL